MCAVMDAAALLRIQLCAYRVLPARQPTFLPSQRRWQPILPSPDLCSRSIAIKYRDRSGNTWAGRGAQPVWLREQLKAGAKLEDFAVDKTADSRKASPRKYKKRRKAKR